MKYLLKQYAFLHTMEYFNDNRGNQGTAAEGRSGRSPAVPCLNQTQSQITQWLNDNK